MIQNINIDSFVIGNEQPVFFIAEAGVNHNGSLDLALKLIDEAKRAGADCIKFQTFKSDKIVTPNAPKAKYQLKTTDQYESQIEMLKKLELSFEDYEKIINHCKLKNILFLSTPYSIEDVDFLEKFNVSSYKIASGQIIEPFFLETIAKKNKPIILSTGMATLGEIDYAVSTIKNTGNKQLILLQCTTNYPSKIEDANLRVIQTLKDTFQLNVGYSDHTENDIAILSSVALGASIIEKHFTLDKTMPGPDHSCSANPTEIKNLITNIRQVEKALGSPVKQPTPIEIQNSIGMRRSIVADCDIQEGEKITIDKLIFKRPATGMPPKNLNLILNKTAKKTIPENSLINFDMINW